MASLANLKGQRTKLVKRITATIESASELLAIRLNEVDLDDTAESVGSHIQLYKDLSERYEALCSKVVTLMNDKDEKELEAEGENSAEIVLDIAEKISKLGSRQKKVTEKLQQRNSNEFFSDVGLTEQLQHLIHKETAVQSNTTAIQNSVNLPKIDFDYFAGDALKWLEFWDSFSASVHLSPGLQPEQKLAYLRAKLRGEAKTVIAGLEMTNDNYEVALSLLRDRFGNEQAAISAHYSRLMDIPASTDHTEKLRILTDCMEQELRCLSSLGEDVNHRHFISLIMHKLPEQVMVKLEEMKGPQEEWTVELLRSKIQIHLTARETASRHHNGRSSRDTYSKGQTSERLASSYRKLAYNNSDQPRESEQTKFESSTTEMLYSSDKSQGRGLRSNSYSQQECVYCHGKHLNDECSRYKTVSARRAQIRGRCYNCLASNHQLRECRSRKSCFYCKEVHQHHSSLCPKKFADEIQTTQVAAESPESNITDESLLASGERALLQTAIVHAFSPLSNRSKMLRVLFDLGSHPSYMSAEAAKSLNLQPRASETISVNTFAEQKSKSVQTKVVDVGFKFPDNSTITITTNVVTTISGSIQRQPLNLTKYNNVLKGLKMANPVPAKQERGAIDILVGSDYYMDLLTFEKIQLDNNLYLLGSKFGWILTRSQRRLGNAYHEHEQPKRVSTSTISTN